MIFVKPRVHIGEIDTTVVLDLASPLIALLLANLLLSLEMHISDLRNTVGPIACSMVAKTHSRSLLPWRIDTRVIKDPWTSRRRDITTKWVEEQMSMR